MRCDNYYLPVALGRHEMLCTCLSSSTNYLVALKVVAEIILRGLACVCDVYNFEGKIEFPVCAHVNYRPTTSVEYDHARLFAHRERRQVARSARCTREITIPSFFFFLPLAMAPQVRGHGSGKISVG